MEIVALIAIFVIGIVASFIGGLTSGGHLKRTTGLFSCVKISE